MFLQTKMSSSCCRPVLESIRGLCSVTGVASGVVLTLVWCLYGHVALWTVLMVLLLLPEDEPPPRQRADAGACKMHEAIEAWKRKWTRAARFEYKCLARVLAACGALSRPPKAVGEVSWWPADCAKMLVRILSTSSVNTDDTYWDETKAPVKVHMSNFNYT